MSIYHRTARAALADPSRGAKSLQSTLLEAFKLAGRETTDVDGNRAWYTTPTSRAPNQDPLDPLEIWHVQVSIDQKANDWSILEFGTRAE